MQGVPTFKPHPMDPKAWARGVYGRPRYPGWVWGWEQGSEISMTDPFLTPKSANFNEISEFVTVFIDLTSRLGAPRSHPQARPGYRGRSYTPLAHALGSIGWGLKVGTPCKGPRGCFPLGTAKRYTFFTIYGPYFFFFAHITHLVF